MSIDNPTEAPEQKPRHPSLAEIVAKIEGLRRADNWERQRILGDKDGIYLYETVSMDANGRGGALYCYRRAGNFPESKEAQTGIDVTYFDGRLADGNFTGGETLKYYHSATGQWVDAK